MSISIDIRDQRLRDGRLHLSSRSGNRKTAQRRESAIRSLLDRGEYEIIERLRARELRIEDVQKAVEDGDLDPLRRKNTEPLTLEASLTRTLQTIEATREPQTLAAYETLERFLLEWKGAAFDVSRLSSDEAEQWLHEPKATNRGRPWGASRQLTMRTLAARVWDDTIRREAEAAALANVRPRIQVNPWKGVEIPDVRKKRVAYLQPEEWQVLLERVRGTPKALGFGLGALAGLRRGEICNLRPGLDVDLDKRVIHVQPRTGEYAWKPKTDRSIRTLDISPELLQLIQEHEPFTGDRYLIRPAEADRPLSGAALRDWAKVAFPAAGLRYGLEGEGLTIHSLRHTFASWAVQDGVSPMVVADLIGDTLQMVVEVYGHLAPRNYREAMERIGRMSTNGGQPS